MVRPHGARQLEGRVPNCFGAILLLNVDARSVLFERARHRDTNLHHTQCMHRRLHSIDACAWEDACIVHAFCERLIPTASGPLATSSCIMAASEQLPNEPPT